MWLVDGSRLDFTSSPNQRCNVGSLSLLLEVFDIPSVRAYLSAKTTHAFSSFVISVILVVSNRVGLVVRGARVLCADIKTWLSQQI